MNDAEAARRFVESLHLHNSPRRSVDSRLATRVQSLEQLLQKTLQAMSRLCEEHHRLGTELMEVKERLAAAETRLHQGTEDKTLAGREDALG